MKKKERRKMKFSAKKPVVPIVIMIAKCPRCGEPHPVKTLRQNITPRVYCDQCKQFVDNYGGLVT